MKSQMSLSWICKLITKFNIVEISDIEEQYEYCELEEYSDEDLEYYQQFANDEEEEGWACDTCEKEFWSRDAFEQHISEHRACGIDGCTFTAHEKIIEKHITMQHLTGLYERICKVNTPDDIAKWIEERKRKYPSKENIEKRYKEQMAKLEQGQRIPKRDNKFGKDKYRLQFDKTKKDTETRQDNCDIIKKKKRKTHQPKPISLIDMKADWNGSMFPFKGTKCLYELEEEVVEESDFEDEEILPVENTASIKPKLNSTLMALMGAYDSNDSGSEPEEVPNKKIDDKVPQTSVQQTVLAQDDNEAPEEIKIIKPPIEQETIKPTNVPESQNIKEQPISNKRKRRQLKNTKGKRKCQPTSSQKSDFPHQKFKRRKVTLLEKLLDSEIRRERNILLQCIRYVVRTDFLSKFS